MFGKFKQECVKKRVNIDLEDTLMASLTYSTENYEESDTKNNFLLDSKKTTVSELDYKGYTKGCAS